MKLLITVAVLLAVGFATGHLMSVAFEPTVSLILSAILGYIYGWFVFYPMLTWSFKK